ncbi:MAG: putative toxin-antitoxin system toxin component, PIN family [Acidimicrobiia bacterium]
MRAVLDPNVIISAALSRGGTPASVFRLWSEGAYELVCSAKLLEELKQALNYPKLARRIRPEEAAQLIDLLAEEASVHVDPSQAPTVLSSDANDNYLIALAENTRSVLVSGDRDLLELADRIPVYSPASFLNLLLPDA